MGKAYVEIRRRFHVCFNFDRKKVSFIGYDQLI
jgi:hypothetical protein